MRQIKDQKNKPIKEHDVLKVFHFVGARKKRYYMYKHVTVRNGELYALHLMPTREGFSDGYLLWTQANENGIIEGTEVVQSVFKGDKNEKSS